MGESHATCDQHEWMRQGTEGFLGHTKCQGPDAWPRGEVSMQSLDPDGCLVRRHHAIDTQTNEDTDAGQNGKSEARRHCSQKRFCCQAITARGWTNTKARCHSGHKCASHAQNRRSVGRSRGR
jgi:hypothetical protein